MPVQLTPAKPLQIYAVRSSRCYARNASHCASASATSTLLEEMGQLKCDNKLQLSTPRSLHCMLQRGES